MSKQILDGCTAAAHVAYALSDVATVYPITPIASMGQTAQQWGLEGRLNLMGQHLEVKEMESELGAAGAVHGAASAGALATTFTSSQGLMLMIPNMYKIAGEQLPVVFHVGCRSLATHALSIFGDHQDVMACRATGFTMLVSASVQETMDLALVAHLASIEGSLPVLHFFDGWRTSSEMDTIDVIPYEAMRPLVDWDAVSRFRHSTLNPEHPRLRGSAQNADVYFQNAEASNPLYDAFPAVMQRAMDKVASVTGRQYHLIDYVGAPDADRVIVIMASGADVAAEAAQYLNGLEGQGYKVGVMKIRLYRPFPTEAFLKALPDTVKSVAVLDRTREPGAPHEPLCLDVISALAGVRPDVKVIGGRYGLSSKEFNPEMVRAVYDYMARTDARSPFTVGINDDVTHLSIPVDDTSSASVLPAGMCQAIFYGIGNDGTVGGTKQVANILGSSEGLYAQAYFSYSAKKSGGYTISQLRVSPRPVTSAYSIEGADYVGCHKASYVQRFPMLDHIADGGIFVINCPWKDETLVRNLPLSMRKTITEKKLRLYTIDADAIAAEVGLSPRINMPMLTVFLYLTSAVPFADASSALQDQIRVTYIHEGEKVVEQNLRAVAMAVPALHEVDYSKIEGWESAEATVRRFAVRYLSDTQKKFIDTIHTPSTERRGDSIPVSAFAPDGTMPPGTTAFEHRMIATRVPVWDAEKCVECTECSLVCPHAAIRPFLLTPDELAKAPEGFVTKPGRGAFEGMAYRIQNYPADCLGCSSCSLICPGGALTMTPIDEVIDTQQPLKEWAEANVTQKPSLLPASTVQGSQLRKPLLEFSGACAGCGETPYVKLLTQLFGPRLIIANATGCSSIWGADYPSNPYTVDADGCGPAWGNSLFEDNAEYGYGMHVAVTHRRARLKKEVAALIGSHTTPDYLKAPLQAWLAEADTPGVSAATGRQLEGMLRPFAKENPAIAELLDGADMFASKSVWAIGGDGWAYDIGFAGLDHVLASGEPVKMLVMDTECYSNTGGQASKATPRACVAKYAAEGKETPRKDLGRMMMTYGYVYVASIALGANYQQAIDALVEAERYPGPAIVIAYCPCINHGIRPGLGHSIVEERRAVEAGYWPLYRFNPEAYARGESGLTIDSVVAGPDHSGHNGSTPAVTSPTYPVPEPVSDVNEYIMADSRYADLSRISPVRAAILRPKLQADCSRANEELGIRNYEL